MQVANDRKADNRQKKLKDTIKAMPYLLPANTYIYYFSYNIYCSHSIY